MATPLRIAYFGTAAFAVPPMEALLALPERFTVVAAVTQPDKAVGRKRQVMSSQVAVEARKHGVPVLQPKTLKDGVALAELAPLQADMFIVAAYGKIVPKAMLELPRLGALNLHGSILPKYRGASPIQAAILAGERETGVSLMVMDDLVDHGPVLATAKAPIGPDDTYRTLERKLAETAAALLVENLEAYANGELPAVEQDHSLATFTKIIGREDGFVSWANETAESVERKSRAFDPWPGIYAVWTRKGAPLRLKLLDIRPVPDTKGSDVPGTVFLGADGFPAVAAKEGAVSLRQVQPEGKKPMTGAAFANGYADVVGATFESFDSGDSPAAG